MSEVKIFKFGGSCLKESNDLEAVVQRIVESTCEKTVIVVSALHGVTDRILERLERNERGSIPAFVASIEMMHLEMSPALVNDAYYYKFQDALAALLDSLLDNCDNPSEPSRVRAQISGEQMSSVAVSAAVGARGIDSKPVWSEEFGIKIHKVKGESVIDINSTIESLNLPDVPVIVVTGWYGMYDEMPALLARGGSDLTATSLAAVLNASEVTIWRDVSGVLALSPRWAIPSRNLPYLSYTEAQELALFSEPVLHPFAVEPLRKEGIPLRLRPLHDPSNFGSCIGPSIATGVPRVRAIGCLPNLVPLTMRLSGVMSVAKVVADATILLDRAHVRVWSLRARPNEARFLVSERVASLAMRLLSESPSLPTPNQGDTISILCLVGESIGSNFSISSEIEEFARQSDLELTHLDEGKRDHALHYTVSNVQTQEALITIAKNFDLLIP